MFDPTAMARLPAPFDPVAQRGGPYARQRTMTLGDLLLENRIIFLGSSAETGGSPVITDYLANLTIQKILFLVTENKSSRHPHVHQQRPAAVGVGHPRPVRLRCSSSSAPVNTYCMGLAASMAAAILLAVPAAKGKRYALPNSKVMIHQPYGQVGGQVSDIEIQANEMIKEHERLNQIMAKHTGQSIDVIAKESDRDRYFSAAEAKEFGLVDDILAKPSAAEVMKK